MFLLFCDAASVGDAELFPVDDVEDNISDWVELVPVWASVVEPDVDVADVEVDPSTDVDNDWLVCKEDVDWLTDVEEDPLTDVDNDWLVCVEDADWLAEIVEDPPSDVDKDWLVCVEDVDWLV